MIGCVSQHALQQGTVNKQNTIPQQPVMRGSAVYLTSAVNSHHSTGKRRNVAFYAITSLDKLVIAPMASGSSNVPAQPAATNIFPFPFPFPLQYYQQQQQASHSYPSTSAAAIPIPTSGSPSSALATAALLAAAQANLMPIPALASQPSSPVTQTTFNQAQLPAGIARNATDKIIYERNNVRLVQLEKEIRNLSTFGAACDEFFDWLQDPRAYNPLNEQNLMRCAAVRLAAQN